MESTESHPSFSKRRRVFRAVASLFCATTVPLSSHAAHLTASDGNASDVFGGSGGVGLIGANGANPVENDNQGLACINRNLDTTSATALTQQLTLIASDGVAEARFGGSVSLSGGVGLVSGQSSAYVYRSFGDDSG